LQRIAFLRLFPYHEAFSMWCRVMGGGTFFKVGGTSARWKTIENFCGLNWQLWRHKH